MKVGDYLIFSYLSRQGKGRACLGKVLSVNPIKVKTQPDINMKVETITIKGSDVFCLLGAKPKPGKVFGVDTANIYRTSKPLANWGELHYFIAPDKQVRKGINTAFSIIYKALKKNGLEAVADKDILFRIWALTGKTNGMCSMNKQGNVIIDIDPMKTTIDDLPHTIGHEIAHYLFSLLEPEQQEKWTALYVNYVRPHNYGSNDCRRIKELVAQADSLSEVKSDLDEEDLELFNSCVKFVRLATHLSYKQLDLFYQSNKELVLSLWPKSISTSDYEAIISQYATKNYKELFAEAFSFYLTGRELPEVVNKLIKRTINHLKVGLK